eukprot:s1143_g5.t4
MVAGTLLGVNYRDALPFDMMNYDPKKEPAAGHWREAIAPDVDTQEESDSRGWRRRPSKIETAVVDELEDKRRRSSLGRRPSKIIQDVSKLILGKSWIGKIPRAEVACADQHALVFVDHGFTPEDVAECENLRENCLHLEAGEMVEVLAGGSGWLYGQVAGHPERAGYFPENRATWLGTCEENGEAAKTDRGVLVKVVENYSPGSPGDKEEEVAFAESCLALAEGDVVEVAASGGGWVYGRVVGSPERHGYFPETRVSWLGKPVERDPEGNEESQNSRVLSSAEETALREAAAAVTQAQIAADSMMMEVS